MSTPITAGMPLSVQNPAVKWVFKPAVMSRSGIVFSTATLTYICCRLLLLHMHRTPLPTKYMNTVLHSLPCILTIWSGGGHGGGATISGKEI